MNERKIQWHIGCSGFHYPDWKLKFYPEGLPQRKWFEYYSEKFDTLELNNTFYSFPRKSLLESWYKRSPEDFVFSIKAPRLITHFNKFENVITPMEDFYEAITEGLREKLGCALFQLPSQVQYSPEKLEQILSSMNPCTLNVVEFRHPGWWNENVFQKLSEHGIVFCGMSHPELPDDVMANTPTLYYRFHGVPDLYVSEYAMEKVQAFADAILHDPQIERVFVYFNNTSSGTAIKNANQLKSIVANYPFTISPPLG